jgi:hypothetical protein
VGGIDIAAWVREVLDGRRTRKRDWLALGENQPISAHRLHCVGHPMKEGKEDVRVQANGRLGVRVHTEKLLVQHTERLCRICGRPPQPQAHATILSVCLYVCTRASV